MVNLEREMQRRFKAAAQKPRKLTTCVNPEDRVARIINRLATQCEPHIGEYAHNAIIEK